MKSKNREILQRVSGIIEGLTCDRRTLWTDLLEPCIGLIKEVLDEEPEEPMKIAIVEERYAPKKI